MKAKKFETLKEARAHTKEANEQGLNFSTHKFSGKRKLQFFSGNWWDWLSAIS